MNKKDKVIKWEKAQGDAVSPESVPPMPFFVVRRGTETVNHIKIIRHFIDNMYLLIAQSRELISVFSVGGAVKN